MNSPHTVPTPAPTFAVSPELVLVDEELGVWARALLEDPDDSLSRATWVQTTAPTAASTEALVALGAKALDLDELEPASPRQPGSLRLAAVVAATAACGLLLLDVHVEVGRTPASAVTTVTGNPPVLAPRSAGQRPPGRRKPIESHANSQSQPSAGSQMRRFAWAPTAGASGYHVELFRGSSRVFAADTKRPQLTIPASWRTRGQRYALEPGEYRWYVWPVVSGQRTSQAIVQAKLVVP